MQYWALFYDLAADYLERRGQFRAEHLDLARAAHARGEIVLAGAFSEPADAALFIFRAADKNVLENFVRADPYVANGLVLRWRIRPWTVVIGNETANPV